MIAPVLNRQFVLDQLELVQAALGAADQPQSTLAKPLHPDLAPEDKAHAAAELTAAKAAELRSSSGQLGYDDISDARRGEEPAPIDDTAFISHEPAIGLLQSALTEYFLTQAPEKIAPPPSPDPDRRAAVADDPVGAAQLIDLPIRPRADDGRRFFDQYSETDPRWIASVVAMGVRLIKHRHAFNPRPATPLKIGPRARLVLVGDWGSGLPRAIAVGKQMRAVIEQGQAAGLEQHVIHLGDVYYSGWEKEYRRNFLPHWPVREGETGPRLRSWCLNGNHDMYAGGHGYFDFLLADARFAAQEKSSFFSLRNDDWDILGLDTAYEDAGLMEPQLGWIQQTRNGSKRRAMLLSHHQLFSAYEKPCVPLQKKIGSYLLANPVDVWFWGHEHRCVFYRESEGVKNARLIGHGGVPVYMPHKEADEYPKPAFYEYRAFTQSLLEKWAYFGFAVVDLDGPKAHVRYIDEFGFGHKKETLP